MAFVSVKKLTLLEGELETNRWRWSWEETPKKEAIVDKNHHRWDNDSAEKKKVEAAAVAKP